MAKMFYTLDETKASLGKSEDEIRQLAKEGQLREFRDGPRLMFKADQVEQLKQQLTGGAPDQVELSGDSGAPIGLADSKTGSGTGISLAPETATPPAAPSAKEDTSAGLDVGLSASLGGSMGGASLAGSIGGSMGATGIGSGMAGQKPGRPGVNVFGGDEGENIDPMAQTHITPPKDQISLEGVGSGSGLLDLTRETDDTSLGAALLDEISPGSTKRTAPPSGAVAAPSAGSTAGMPAVELEPSAMIEDRGTTSAPPAYVVTAPDSMAPAFVAAGIAALVVVFMGALVLINAVVGSNPMVDARFDFVRSIGDNHPSIGFPFIIGLVLAIVFFVVGLLMGKMSTKQAA